LLLIYTLQLKNVGHDKTNIKIDVVSIDYMIRYKIISILFVTIIVKTFNIPHLEHC